MSTINRRDCGKGLLGLAALAYGPGNRARRRARFRRRVSGNVSVIFPIAIWADGRTACR